MKTSPLVAATVDFSDPAAPRAPAFDDLYHPRSGAFAQAQQVFLAGNGLPSRWRGRARFTILETGFGLGNNFLATWAAWRADPARSERLTFLSIEKHPLLQDDLVRSHGRSPAPDLAQQLLDAWPPATCNLHGVDFEAGRVRLLLALGDVQSWARELVAGVDAFYLDGFAPARNDSMWDRGVFAMLARLAAPDASAATWSAAHAVREGLQRAGFEVRAAPGSGGKRDITLARFAPRFRPPPPPGRVLPRKVPTHALVVGGGLAGAATARALALQGIACTVLDAHAEPAAEASGNPAGLFHGAVMGHDGPHARLLRAAALVAAPVMRAAAAAGVPAGLDGLLRLEARLLLPAMQALLDRQALPASYVQALSAMAATQCAGAALSLPAWFYPGGGWIDPAALVRHWLSTPCVTWRGSTPVQRIAHDGHAWSAFDAGDRTLASAPLLVLANAADALRLAGLPPAWLQRQRGQVSWTRNAAPAAPRIPIASGGYVLTLPSGQCLYGATSQVGDEDPSVRASDQRDNLAKAMRLIGEDGFPPAGEAHRGRVGWRATSTDRLPLVGPVPDRDAPRPSRADAPRLLPRRPGLWLHSGLGSRGLTTATLCADLIAAQVTGAPWPLEADLADAIDPARWLLRVR
ncbi:MAG TPA: FAD-dependent 5-carboxymethylaminomethyl-2-thiouridine(34) oxidoreductase MnmC [Burkholderiaceae bacterium]